MPHLEGDAPINLLNLTTDTSAERDVDLCVAIPQSLTTAKPQNLRVIYLGTVAYENAA